MRLLLLAGAAEFGMAAAAAAQGGVTVTPSIAGNSVYDGNVFLSPAPESDFVWRVTSGVGASDENPRGRVAGHYSFDAEQYRDHPELTTPLARQDGDFHADLHPTINNAMHLVGDYNATHVPSELNLTTGLVTGRLQGWQAHGGGEIEHAVSARTTLVAGYDFTQDEVSGTGGARTHAGKLGAVRRLTSVDDLRVTYTVDRFSFEARQPTVLSQVGTLGWTHAVGPGLRLSVDAGVRRTGAQLQPEVTASFSHKAGPVEATLGYSRTQTTALGVLEPIGVQSIVASAAYRQPLGLEAVFDAAVYRNTFGAAAIRAAHVSASLLRHVSGAVSLSASVAYDIQSSTVPLGTPTGVTAAAPIRRTVMLVGITVAPTFHTRPEPPPGSEGPASLGGAR